MTLEKLQEEMISALKAKNKFRKDVLSELVGAVKKAAIDNRCKDNITEELVNTTLLKEQKTMQEMIDTCPIERTETLTIYKAKMEIIKEFSPQLLTDREMIKSSILDLLCKNSIDATKKNKGEVMKIVMPAMRGKADMKVVSDVIGEILV